MTIALYTWSTPNGRKVSIMLEELGLPYEVRPIDITKGEQHEPEFLKISPNNKIPAIVDSDGPDGRAISLFESGAILIYLAEKTGQLIPSAPRARYRMFEWLMWQMGNFGPMLGQAHHFRRFAKVEVPYGIARYSDEAQRLWGVLDDHLAEVPFLAGEDYSIADIATYPWAARHAWQGVELDDFPNAKRWYEVLGRREAVIRGMAVPG